MDYERQPVRDALAYLLDARAKAKQSTREQKLIDATLLLLVMERFRVALDAWMKAAVEKAESRLSE